MHIYIRTYGRPSRDLQHTARMLWDAEVPFTFVVQQREFNTGAWRWCAEQRPNQKFITLPPAITHLYQTDQYLMETAHLDGADYVLLMDDDISFAIRRMDELTKFRPATPEDVHDVLKDIAFHVKELHHPLVGVAGREGANRDTADYKYATRQMRCNAIDVSKFHELGIRFDRVPLMEDFDVILQFLSHGYPNCVINWAVQDQRGSGVKGGVTHYRTDELQKKAAEMLAARHPGYVKVVQRHTKTSWGGDKTRYDVTVQWKNCLRDAENRQ